MSFSRVSMIHVARDLRSLIQFASPTRRVHHALLFYLVLYRIYSLSTADTSNKKPSICLSASRNHPLQNGLRVGRARNAARHVERHARKQKRKLVEPVALGCQPPQVEPLADRHAPAGQENFVQVYGVVLFAELS